MHISEVREKTAENLAVANLEKDHYHQSIRRGAMLLVKKQLPKAKFVTQYSSGSTFWHTERGGFMVTNETLLENHL